MNKNELSQIVLNYDDYWNYRNQKEKNKLKQRDFIFANWIKSKTSVLVLGCGQSLILSKL